MNKEEAFHALMVLQEHAKRIANELKCDPGRFNITLDETGEGNHMISIGFIMRPEAIMNDGELEQKGFDDQFASMSRVLEIEKRNSERAEKASAEISDWLKGTDEPMQGMGDV